MMKHILCWFVVASTMSQLTVGAEPTPTVTGLKNPESVCLAADGKLYVTSIGEFDKDQDGIVYRIENDKAVPFAKGLDDPKGIVAFQNDLFVTDRNRVWRIPPTGQPVVHVPTADFPIAPLFLNDIEVDRENGALYLSDSGDLKGKGGAVFRIDPKTKKVTTITDSEKFSGIHSPNGLAMDGSSHLLLGDFGTGHLHRIKIATGTATLVAKGFDGFDGIAMDKFGRVYVSSWKSGQVWGIPRPGVEPILVAKGFETAADLCLNAAGTQLVIPDMKKGTLSLIPASIPGWEVDERPLNLKTELTFTNIQWSGWRSPDDAGKVQSFRPLLVTHAGDGSQRVFVMTQQGVIHVFPSGTRGEKDSNAKESRVFLDLTSKVRYSDNENEEGLLGLAFHPRYKENGSFFVFYTDKRAKLQNVVSRFKVSKDDPNRADPASETELLRFSKPFWNHDGGTIAFGKDGYLYVTHGDGGSANDPHENGQNLKTLLGKVLRIDVDSSEASKPYAIPKDNPFVGRTDAAPEIWAYGLRNVWRMSFDRKTGQLWAGDVGQNLWEEINLIHKGGNYGWNRREACHPFGVKGEGARADLIDPIWEYHHDIGKSITAGCVYRGKRHPELDGAFLYADYVSGRVWALWYDEIKKRVVANRPIQHNGLPILSFGEDEAGEVYLMTHSVSGKGIFGLVSK